MSVTKHKKLLQSLFIGSSSAMVMLLVCIAATTATVAAVTAGGVNAGPLPHVDAGQATIDRLLNIFFRILGGVALLVISVGGLRYIFANGDANSIVQAKNTILYALIGLVIAVTGYAIVNFVLQGLGS